MNELKVVESQHEIPAKLDAARRALAEATEDWQRIDIRNYARAVAAASAILERKDIQVQAANLVQDAERAIAKANPPPSPQESGAAGGRKTAEKNRRTSGREKHNPILEPEKPRIPNWLIKETRKAHDNLSDEEYEKAKAEAVETGKPLTRDALQQISKVKRQAEIRQKREEQLAKEKAQIEIALEISPEQFLHIRLDEGMVNWHNALAHTSGPGRGNDLGKMTVAEARQLQKDFQRVMHPDKNSWYAERTHQEQLNWIALRDMVGALLESLERQITINVTGGKHEKL